MFYSSGYSNIMIYEINQVFVFCKIFEQLIFFISEICCNLRENFLRWICSSHDLAATISVALMIYWATPPALGQMELITSI